MGRRPRATLRRGASWPDASRKGAVCSPHVAQNALFRYIAAREAWGATPRQPAGHYEKWPNWANALGQPPARLRGGCARARRPRPGPTPHGKAQSAAPMSRRMRLSVTSPPGRRGAQPPASLRGTMESGPTGQMRPGNPPPGCGGGSARVRKPRPEVRHLTEKRSLGRGPR